MSKSSPRGARYTFYLPDGDIKDEFTSVVGKFINGDPVARAVTQLVRAYRDTSRVITCVVPKEVYEEIERRAEAKETDISGFVAEALCRAAGK